MRLGGTNRVVPIPVERMGRELNDGHLCGGHLDGLGIHVRIECAAHRQAFLRAGGGDTGTVYDDLTIEAWDHGADPRWRCQSAESAAVLCRWGAAPRVRQGRLRRDDLLGARGNAPARVWEREIVAAVGVERCGVKGKDLAAWPVGDGGSTEAAGGVGLRGFLLAVGGGLCERCGRALTAIMKS